MNELEQIIKAYQQCRDSGKSSVLATLVKLQGSHYRKPGAQALIVESGEFVGNISGGCLETDLLHHAKKALSTGEILLMKYDTSSPEDIVFGLGIGCGGEVDILLEPVSVNKSHFFLEHIGRLIEQDSSVRSVVIHRSGNKKEVGNRLFLAEDNRLITDIVSQTTIETIQSLVRKMPVGSNSANQISLTELGEMEIFSNVICPPINLLVIGAGSDALPLVSFAKRLGWRVTVTDHRPAYLTKEKFPDADNLVQAASENLVNSVNLSKVDAAVILTHNYLRDAKLLKILLPVGLDYLGLLGTKIRTDNLLKEVELAEVMSISDARKRLHSPVGLDIGSETPAEIALSIVSEIQAILSKSAGDVLKSPEIMELNVARF